jgi:EAL domain-containing protein (putative c-di-GMP-specific phosphodiesterase class I)/ActR/RegA family two-component response regulator
MGVSRILVVDDDPTVRGLVGLTLALEGIEVAAVDDGPAALAHLRRHHVDVVLLDRLMPGMDGLEVLAEIRADPALADVSVVLITGVDGTAGAVEGLDTGADDYIVKPFAPDELAARVRAQLRGRRRTGTSLAGGRSPEHQAAEALIRDLVRDRAFRSVFQPIVDLDSREVVGHEALTRFDAGIDPAEMFSTASRLGIGGDLERATLALAVDGARRQQPDTWLALNVTPSLLLGRTGLDLLLRRTGRDDLVLEISEMEPVHDYGALLAAIDALGASVQISVDDAGAGFASLAHILALRARYVKLDKSWIHGIDVEPAKRALVAGLQGFATETGAALIAEGVETQAQLDAVCELGIPYGQGFLLGRPGDL